MTEYKLIDVTPEMAEQLLSRNYENNRRINKSAVTAMARDMKEGRYFSQNGQTITLTADGCLIDGQHRLSAVIESGITQRFLFAVLDDEANCETHNVFSTIDCGRARSLAQFVNGPARSNVAAAARIAYAVEHGTGSLASTMRGDLAADHNAARASVPALKEYMDAHEAELHSISLLARRVYRANKGGSIAMFSGAIFLLGYLHSDAHVDAFVDDISALIPAQTATAAFSRYVKRNGTNTGNAWATRMSVVGAFLYAYGRFCDGTQTERIRSATIDATIERYDKLLKLERALRNSNVPLYGADNA